MCYDGKRAFLLLPLGLFVHLGCCGNDDVFFSLTFPRSRMVVLQQYTIEVQLLVLRTPGMTTRGDDGGGYCWWPKRSIFQFWSAVACMAVSLSLTVVVVFARNSLTLLFYFTDVLLCFLAFHTFVYFSQCSSKMGPICRLCYCFRCLSLSVRVFYAHWNALLDSLTLTHCCVVGRGFLVFIRK